MTEVVEIPEAGRTAQADPEFELVARARAAAEGDTHAFEELVRLYQRRIVANCRQITSGNDAEDLAQEVFVKVYFAIRSFEGKSSFNHWVRRIKVNHCLNHLKRSQRNGFEVDVQDEELHGNENLQVAAAAHERLETGEQNRRIGEILTAMPQTMRLPLVMCDMDGFSYEDIAAALGIGLSAVKMRIKRAREQFRRLYGEKV